MSTETLVCARDMLIPFKSEKVEYRRTKALTNMGVRLEKKFAAIKYPDKRVSDIQNSQVLGNANSATLLFHTRSDFAEQELRGKVQTIEKDAVIVEKEQRRAGEEYQGGQGQKNIHQLARQTGFS